MVRAIYHLARAKYLERVRRYSFLVIVTMTVLAAYIFLPPNHSTYATIQMGGHRGLYNSAWVGTVTSLMSTVYIFLTGFFLIRNAIGLDRSTGVGEVIASTPVRRVSYALGTALSNFAIFATMTGVLILAATAMQWIRGEEYALQLVQLTGPFLLVTLPVAAIIAAAAVLSESIRFLRGIVGGVMWVALWISSLVTDGFRHWDIYGMTRTLTSMKESCALAFADYGPASGHSIGFNFREGGLLWDLTTFAWDGVPLTSHYVSQRIELMAFAVLVASSSAIFFDRFRKSDTGVSRLTAWFQNRVRGLAEIQFPRRTQDPISEVGPITIGTLTRVEILESASWSSWLILHRAEWRLAILQNGFLWQVVALGLIVASLFSPLDVVRHYLWPAAWFWPVLVWSSLGSREIGHNMDQIVFSSPQPVVRQLIAMWTAGVAVALVTGGAIALRLLIAGELGAFLAFCVGAAFVPSLALASGVWTRSGKLFEALFIILMYLCSFEQIAVFDFMGITTEGPAQGIPVVYLLVTGALLAVAIIGRQRYLREQ